MHYGHGFGLRSCSGTSTSLAIIYLLGPLVLDTQMLGIGSPKLAEPALSFLPRVDCVLTSNPVASCFVELGPPLGAH